MIAFCCLWQYRQHGCSALDFTTSADWHDYQPLTAVIYKKTRALWHRFIRLEPQAMWQPRLVQCVGSGWRVQHDKNDPKITNQAAELIKKCS